MFPRKQLLEDFFLQSRGKKYAPVCALQALIPIVDKRGCSQLSIMGTSINCPGGANFQYPRTNSVGYIKQIHHSVLKARALKNE